MRSFFQSTLESLDREAWRRFFVAVGGLGFAFVLALSSTGLRQSGNVIGTAIAASSALLIAGWVALTTVPYLARRVALKRIPYNFDYELTREGAAYLGVALIIAVAALNTGNNLLFLVLAAMLAAIVVSGIVSAVSLRGVDLQVSLPSPVFARRPVIGRLTLRNRRRFLSVFSISVIPLKKTMASRRSWQRGVFAFPPHRSPDKQWLRIPDLQWKSVATPEVAGIFRSPVYFAFIPPHSALNADVELHFLRRGRYVQDGFGISTRFPFSFLVKTRSVRLAKEIIVYPSVEPTDEFFEVLPMITGEFETFVRGRGYELYRIRDYAPEDTARHVDWKATAKSGALKVREFSREDERKLRIVFDNPSPGVAPETAYENAVALAASLAWHFADGSTELSFSAPGCEDCRDLFSFLDYLAMVEPRSQASIIDSLPATDHYNIIITARLPGTVPTALWATSYIVFIQKEENAT